MGAVKNTPKYPRIGTDTRRKIKKGTSTPKKKKTLLKKRFYEIKIRITAEEFERGLPFFEGQKYLQKYVLDAYREKVKRAEAHDKEAKQKTLINNAALLEPAIIELHKQGKLDFLIDKSNGGEKWQDRKDMM